MKIQPHYSAAPTPFRHTWSGVVNIDQFRHLLRRDAQSCVQTAHGEIGARHVRAVGMLDDYLGAYGRDPQSFAQHPQTLRSNWRNVFFVVDQLVESGVAPMFTTCFTPSKMARSFSGVFGGGASAAPPADMKIWSDFLIEGAQLCVARYGEKSVEKWLFEAWNEPNLGCFFNGTQHEFFELWAHTFRALKNVNANFQIGGPSTARAEWLGDFIEWTRKNGCEPDYLVAHIYNNDSENSALSPFDGPQDEKQNASPHFAGRVMLGARQQIDETGFRGALHWNEWGRSWLPCDAVRESAQEAAFIVKTMSETSQSADVFAYWCLSDVYDQIGYGREAFHGNYGMISLDGLKKPSYFAHQLLEKLGESRIEIGGDFGADFTSMQNAIATPTRDGFAVLVYAIEDEFAVGNSRKTSVEIALPTGFSGALKLWRVGENENNIQRAWEEIGSPPYPTRAQTDDLRARNVLQSAATNEVRVLDNAARFEMTAPGIALLEIAVREC